MSKLAAFPKCFMDQLCVDHSMTLFEWIELASTLDVDGLEFYFGFVDSLDEASLDKVKQKLQEKNLEMPMLCYSPNFTIADSAKRQEEIVKQNAMVDLTARLGGKFCRVLSGQAYPNLSRKQGVAWVNDSQATIPLAVIGALDAFAPAPVVLIAGGKDKGLDYGALADAIAGRCRAAVLIGETAERLEQLIARRVPVVRVGSMSEAVAVAGAWARPGDVVVLAPAAASFDMFDDYAARGDAFRAAVQALDAGEPDR